MKSFVLLIVICLAAIDADAQRNRKPRIVSQDVLTTNEDQNITVQLTDLEVTDADDWFYPWGFTMQFYAGPNYTFQGQVVTPAPDFSGKLIVKVSVNDGEDESNKFDLEITVNPLNDKPVITGQAALTVNEGQAIAILPQHLKVKDPDNKYPEEFTHRVLNGNNYSVSSNQITPQPGFSGTLPVNVVVNDGTVDSDVYVLNVTVNAFNRVPQITGQATLQVNEDQSIVILLSHLTVVDADSNYPNGFTLALSPGENYSTTNSTVTPAKDFFGKITVPVTVNDGKNTSKPFNLSIAVTPVNDPPVVINLETVPIAYRATDASVAISENVTVTEVDGDSIMYAEVGINGEFYQADMDKLVYTPAPNSKIRGVFEVSTGILTLLGQASPSSYSRALKSVQFQNTMPATGVTKKLFIIVNDGKTESAAVEREIRFGQANVSLDIPSGFTPNGDLANDTWKIIPLQAEEEYAQARIRVYNKAGHVVYESVGFDQEWDGRLNGELLPADTYFYTIDLNINAPEGYLKGLVTILR